ncbi:MAG: ABC transporter ATP-binding protein [Blastocatellia bacterium]|nr:ABC transporter ATP-binding protein [Blastocatellia bacterium]
MRRSRRQFCAAVFWRTVFVILPMQVPVLTGALIDAINGKAVILYGVIALPGSRDRVLGLLFAGLTALALGYGASAHLRTTATARLSRHFVFELRRALLAKFEAMSLELHQRYGAGELLQRTLADAQSLRQFVEGAFARGFTHLAQVVYPLSMLLWLDWRLALVSLSVLPPQWLIVTLLQKRLHRAVRRARAAQSTLATEVKERLDGVETVRTLNAGEAFTERLLSRAQAVEADELRANRHTALISASIWTLTSVGYALAWWRGGLRVIEGGMTLGSLIVFTSFVAFVYTPFRRFTNIVGVYRRGLVALERIQEVLSLPDSVVDEAGARPLHITEARIEFQGVGLSRGPRGILRDATLSLAPNQLIAIMGPSGAGKSTLLNLLARLLDPTEGRVLIDGQDLRRVTIQSLRGQIGHVPQRPFIFSGSVEENLRIARPEAVREEIEQACREAEAWEFIQRMEHGLDTRLGSGGVALSGGEAQRIALARALLRGSRILLLDEPTSALDAETEAAIMKTLARLKQDRIILMVGHHSEAVSPADRILRLEEGRLIELPARPATGARERQRSRVFAMER